MSCSFLRDSLSLVLLLFAPAVVARPAQPSEGPQQYAILIGVQKHQHEHLNLAYTLNDAVAVRKVLVGRAGVPSDHILELTDTAKEQPTLANLRRTIPPFLAKLRKADRLIVFFAGHGFLEGNTTFLVARDSDPAKLGQTALPTTELRQWLDQCQAREKFLVLDCCHAGGSRNISPGKSSEEVARPLEDSSVVVLASCARKQLSWEWNEQRHGVFTYWLCKAFEGGADESRDGLLSIDEVFKYVESRVRESAQTVLERKQTPRLIRGSEVEGIPILLKLEPEEPETLCRRLAVELDLHLRRLRLKRALVLPDLLVPLGRKEGGARASLPGWLAAKVREGLLAASQPDPGKPAAYTVLTEEKARAAARGFRFDSLGKKEDLARMSQEGGGVDVVLSGTLRERGKYLHLDYELIAATSGDVLDRAAGVLPISATLLAQNGDSANLLKVATTSDPRNQQVLAAIVESRQEGHPLLQSQEKFPFRVEVLRVKVPPSGSITNQTPRQVCAPISKAIDGKNCLVIPFKKGDIYELRIHNQYPQRVGVTVLVDGINALGGKRERLGKAWSWVVDKQQSLTVEGWSVPREDASKVDQTVKYSVKRFQIVDLADSVAGRQGFTDQLGVITVAFFAGGARALGTGYGPEEQRQFKTTDFHLGALLGVVHLHYIDAKEAE